MSGNVAISNAPMDPEKVPLKELEQQASEPATKPANVTGKEEPSEETPVAEVATNKQEGLEQLETSDRMVALDFEEVEDRPFDEAEDAVANHPESTTTLVNADPQIATSSSLIKDQSVDPTHQEDLSSISCLQKQREDSEKVEVRFEASEVTVETTGLVTETPIGVCDSEPVAENPIETPPREDVVESTVIITISESPGSVNEASEPVTEQTASPIDSCEKEVAVTVEEVDPMDPITDSGEDRKGVTENTSEGENNADKVEPQAELEDQSTSDVTVRKTEDSADIPELEGENIVEDEKTIESSKQPTSSEVPEGVEAVQDTVAVDGSGSTEPALNKEGQELDEGPEIEATLDLLNMADTSVKEKEQTEEERQEAQTSPSVDSVKTPEGSDQTIPDIEQSLSISNVSIGVSALKEMQGPEILEGQQKHSEQVPAVDSNVASSDNESEETNETEVNFQTEMAGSGEPIVPLAPSMDATTETASLKPEEMSTDQKGVQTHGDQNKMASDRQEASELESDEKNDMEKQTIALEYSKKVEPKLDALNWEVPAQTAKSLSIQTPSTGTESVQPETRQPEKEVDVTEKVQECVKVPETTRSPSVDSSSVLEVEVDDDECSYEEIVIEDEDEFVEYVEEELEIEADESSFTEVTYDSQIDEDLVMEQALAEEAALRAEAEEHERNMEFRLARQMSFHRKDEELRRRHAEEEAEHIRQEEERERHRVAEQERLSRKRAEEAAAQIAQQEREELRRLLLEEETRRKAAEAEAHRLAAEAVAREKEMAEQERRIAEEKEKREREAKKREMEEEVRRLQDRLEEAKRAAEEVKQRKQAAKGERRKVRKVKKAKKPENEIPSEICGSAPSSPAKAVLETPDQPNLSPVPKSAAVSPVKSLASPIRSYQSPSHKSYGSPARSPLASVSPKRTPPCTPWSPPKAPSPKQEVAESPSVPQKSAGGPNEGDTAYYTADQLRRQEIPGLDYKNREIYLHPDEFKQIFEMTKEEFNELPKWKRTNMKRKKKLF